MILTTSWQKVAEASYQVTSNTVGYLRLYLKYGDRDVANNRDTIYYEVRLFAYNRYGNYLAWEWQSALPWNILAGGEQKASGSYVQSPAIYANSGEYVKASGSWIQNHDSNGSWERNITLNGYIYTHSSSCAGSVSLPNIARKSTISVNNGNIGSNTSINISCADNSFTHTLTYSFSGLSGTIATKTATKPIFTWQIPSSFYAKLPNASSGTVTVNCETFSGNTSLGTTSTTFTAYVTNSKPEFDTTITDSNSVANALTGNNTKFIKGYSNAYIQSLVTTKNSATRSSYSVSNGTQSSSTYPNATINAILEKTFTFNTRDSRGDTPTTNSEYPTYTIANDKWIEYFKPAITSILIERTEQTSTEVEANISGSFFNSSFGSVSNTLKYAWRKKESSSETWGSWSNLTTPTISSNSFNITNLSLGNSYATDKSYDFQFKFVDELGSRDSTQIVIPIVQTVTVSIPIVEIGEDSIAISGTFYMLVNDTLVPILEIVDE